MFRYNAARLIITTPSSFSMVLQPN